MIKFFRDINSKRERITYTTLFVNAGLVVFLTLREMEAAGQALIIGTVDAVIAWYMQKETERKSEATELMLKKQEEERLRLEQLAKENEASPKVKD